MSVFDVEIEYSKDVFGFPNYEITSFGRVINKKTGRQMVLSPTIQGDLTVGLTFQGNQYRRSVKVLVARAFVSGETEVFNTPILLDNDKNHLHASNIRWRPRWFAWEYKRQFVNIPIWVWDGPLWDMTSGTKYEHIYAAAVKHGNLFRHIYDAIPSETHVYPTGERYIYLTEE